MVPPNPVDVMERGVAAEALLATPTFSTVINDLSNLHVTAMCVSPEGPRGADAREHHHRMHLAVAEIVETLRGYVAAAHELIRKSGEDADLAEEDLP